MGVSSPRGDAIIANDQNEQHKDPAQEAGVDEMRRATLRRLGRFAAITPEQRAQRPGPAALSPSRRGGSSRNRSQYRNSNNPPEPRFHWSRLTG